MKHSKRIQLILAIAVVATLVVPWTAFADPISNNIDLTVDPELESRTIVPGGNTTVGFYDQPSNDVPTPDANGCNATGGAPAIVTLSIPPEVTATAPGGWYDNQYGVIKLQGCDNLDTLTTIEAAVNVSFSSSAVGSWNISVSNVTGGKANSAFTWDGAAFTLIVSSGKTTPTITWVNPADIV